jgi:hypothetical protein
MVVYICWEAEIGEILGKTVKADAKTNKEKKARI